MLPPLGVTGVKLRGLHLVGTPFDFEWTAVQLCAATQAVPPGQPPVHALILRDLRAGTNVTLTAAPTCVALGPVEVIAFGCD